MSILLEVQRSKCFKEFSTEEQEIYFSLIQKKVLHNVDTLYYTIALNEAEIIESGSLARFLDFLANKKRDCLDSKTKELEVNEFVMKPFGFSIYEYRLGIENLFDFFIGTYLPNAKTPRIVVQLRSVGLWLDGEQHLIKQSFDMITLFLNSFDISVESTSINRIDYAYHTNLIQSTYKFFNDDLLIHSLKTKMKIGHKVFRFGRELFVDYLSLGNQKSNNVFFRAYNKTKEVVEMQYKGFFIDVWHKNGLISEFDKYCLEYAYKKGSYNAIILGRMEWYIEYGHDYELKQELRKAIQSCHVNSDNYEYMERLISGVIPEVTTIVNIEFQTKRKYYATMHHLFMQSLRTSIKPESKLFSLFQIVDNKKQFLDYLTSETVCFYRNNADIKPEVASWWQRIQSCKVKTLSGTTVIREYGRNLDLKRVEARTVNSLASMSAYRHGAECEKQSFSNDISDMLCSLNDNDLKHIDIMLVDTNTGEVKSLNCADYSKKKHRQLRRIRPFLGAEKVDWRSEVLKSQITEDNLKNDGLLLTVTCKDETGFCPCDSCYYCYKGEVCAFPGECKEYEKYKRSGE